MSLSPCDFMDAVLRALNIETESDDIDEQTRLALAAIKAATRPDAFKSIDLDEREHATILAALGYYADESCGRHSRAWDWIKDTATNCGAVEMMEPSEVRDLARSINGDDIEHETEDGMADTCDACEQRHGDDDAECDGKTDEDRADDLARAAGPCLLAALDEALPHLTDAGVREIVASAIATARGSYGQGPEFKT